MKTLMVYIFLLLGILAWSAPAAAEDPVDLVALQEAGLSAETIGRYLAQNLDSTRVAPPISAGLLSRLGEYGGDGLAQSYLNLDKQTAHLQRRDFSPEVIEQLLASNVGAEKLKNVLDGEAVKANQAASASQAAMPALPRTAGAVTESDLTPPVAKVPPSAPSGPVAAAAPPTPTLSAPPALAAPVSPVPSAPQTAAPAVQVPPVPSVPQPRFQDLRPGQAADPASKLPVPQNTYEIRQPAAEGPWMGVTERELADGHRVEVNIMGNPNLVGQEVLSRPSGHKVYRYHSGNTDRPAPMADPAQERKNREDLQIIYGGSK